MLLSIFLNKTIGTYVTDFDWWYLKKIWDAGNENGKVTGRFGFLTKKMMMVTI